MNFLAHAAPLLFGGEADPYEVAGVAVPDWLGVAARRVKCPSKHAAPCADHPDRPRAGVARGVMRHHADDGWFHESRAFGELSLDFARRLRGELGDDSGMRPWFVGHILVEMLLDASLDRARPGLLDQYYSVVACVDPQRVGDAVQRMCGREVPRLPECVERFLSIGFLRDYRTDEGLLFRLNQVMRRVGLPALPPSVLPLLASFRAEVSDNRERLLSPPAAGRPRAHVA